MDNISFSMASTQQESDSFGLSEIHIAKGFGLRSGPEYKKQIAKFRNIITKKQISKKHSDEALNLEKITLEQEEMDININRITNIINHSIQLIEILAILPLLKKDNGRLMYEYFPKFEADYILNTLSQQVYKTVKPKHNYDEFSKDCYADHNMVVDLESRKNMDLLKVLHYLHSSDRLRRCLPRMARFRSPYMNSIREGLKEFVKIIAVQGRETASFVRARRVQIKEAYIILKAKSVLIREFDEEKNKRIQVHGKKIEELDKKIQFYLDKMNNIKVNTQAQINQRVQKSIHNQCEASALYDIRKVDLLESYATAEKATSLQLEKNLAEEKIMRSAAYKTESYLAQLISKYDQDVAQRQEEFEILSESLQETNDELKIIQAKYDEIVILYAECEEEWEYDVTEFGYKIREKMVLRIQKFWRAYRERKKALRKAKRKKKSKKK